MLAYRQLQQASVQFALQNREQGEEDEDLGACKLFTWRCPMVQGLVQLWL